MSNVSIEAAMFINNPYTLLYTKIKKLTVSLKYIFMESTILVNGMHQMS